LRDRCRRLVRTRAFGAGRERDVRLRRRLAGGTLWRGNKEDDRPQAGDPLEQRTLCARRLVRRRSGSQFARRQFLDPIADNVWYAGEAAHETLWGTVGGAWESGERAADAALRQLGPIKQAAPAVADTKSKIAPKHARAERREPRREATSPQYYGGTPSIMREER